MGAEALSLLALDVIGVYAEINVFHRDGEHEPHQSTELVKNVGTYLVALASSGH